MDNRMNMFCDFIKYVRGSVRCAALVLQDMPVQGVPDTLQIRAEELAADIYDIDDKLLKFQRDANRARAEAHKKE